MRSIILAVVPAMIAAGLVLVSCSDSSTKPAHYTVSIGIDRTPVTVNATYTFIAEYTGGPAVSSPRTRWLFGDGTPAQTVFTDRYHHVYSEPGEYTVEVELFDNSDGSRLGSATRTVSVQNYQKGLSISPDTAYGAANVTQVQYTLTYTGTPVGNITYFWDFGDGSGSQLGVDTTMSYLYKQPGLYDVSCILWDATDGVGRDTAFAVAVIQ
jgi:hypothetical protein